MCLVAFRCTELFCGSRLASPSPRALNSTRTSLSPRLHVPCHVMFARSAFGHDYAMCRWRVVTTLSKCVKLLAHVLYMHLGLALLLAVLYDLKLVVYVRGVFLITDVPRRLHLGSQSRIILLDAALVVTAKSIAAQVRVVCVEICLCLLRRLGVRLCWSVLFLIRYRKMLVCIPE